MECETLKDVEESFNKIDTEDEPGSAKNYKIMETETLKDVEQSFNDIDVEDEPGSEKNYIYVHNPFKYCYKAKPILRYIPKKYINFEQYVNENCHNKIQILNRDTFQHIKRPIIIFFNHFREKCAYLTEWLDKLYQLALKYGDRIEFIAADMIDIDVMYPGSNPLNFFCRIVRSVDESPRTYAIDEKKRIHELHDAYKTVETLLELCENLLRGSLFPSLPLPKNNETNLVKICVHHNYEEVILKSNKNIFLIVNMERFQQYEPSFENVALALKDYNLDIVYMEVEKNYIPFEYHAKSYPTILFIPCNDKNNFIYFEGQRNENTIIEFLKNIMEHPEILQQKQQELKSRTLQKNVLIPNDFQIDFSNLPKFFQQNFNKRFQVFDRQILEKCKGYSIIIFLDFPDMKCSAHHVQWLNKIYQVVQSSYSYQFFVADFKDIDIINTKWKPQAIKNSAQGKPKIYAIDHLKHTYEFGNFDSPPALFYFTESVISRHLYYTQLYQRKNLIEAVKEWTADYFDYFLKKCKKHIFITFYLSADENSERLQNLLDQIAADVTDLNVEIAKFDVKLNYVDLEYAHDSYPVHYFIPKNNKRDARLYIDNDLNAEKMLEFIRSNLKLLK